MARDWRGIPFSTLPEPTSPDFTFRLRNMLSEMDAWARDQSLGMARISRGEVPDGSGDPISPGEVDLSQFFFLPGRGGGQDASGGTGSGDDLILRSTAHATKGNIFLGSSSSYDETNVLFGIGDASPNAVLHANMVSPPTYVFPTADLTDGGWVTQVGGTTLFSAVNDSDDTDYITETDPPGSGASCALTFWVAGAAPLAGTETVAVNFRIRRTIGSPPDTGNECLLWSLKRGGVEKATATTTHIAQSSTFIDFSTTLSASAVLELVNPSGNVTIDFNMVGIGDTTMFYQISQIALVVGSQADLLRWDSGGTQLGRIDVSGRMGIGTSSDSLSAMLTVEPSAAATVGELIQGATSQSGNLLEFRDSASALLSRFTSAGVYDGPITTTGAVSVTDSTFTILDDATPSKVAKFQCSGITAANTRTLTVPDASGTLPTLENAHDITGVWTFNPGAAVGTPIMVTAPGGSFSGTGPLLTDGTGFYAELQLPLAGLTADRFIIFPDGSGSVVLGGVASNLRGNVSSIFDTNTNISGASFADTGSISKRLRFVLSGASANNHSITLTNTAGRNYGLGNLSGNVVVVGDDAPAVASGALGKVDLTAQTADITTTNLSSTPPAGVYAVEVYLMCTTSDVTAGTLTVTIGWTDDVGATTDATSIAAFPLTATGRAKAVYAPLRVNSGDITYAVAVTGIYGTSQYAIYVRTISLG